MGLDLHASVRRRGSVLARREGRAPHPLGCSRMAPSIMTQLRHTRCGGRVWRLRLIPSMNTIMKVAITANAVARSSAGRSPHPDGAWKRAVQICGAARYVASRKGNKRRESSTPNAPRRSESTCIARNDEGGLGAHPGRPRHVPNKTSKRRLDAPGETDGPLSEFRGKPIRSSN